MTPPPSPTPPDAVPVSHEEALSILRSHRCETWSFRSYNRLRTYIRANEQRDAELAEVKRVREIVRLIEDLELDGFWNFDGKYFVDCSDSFYWACADAEELNPEDGEAIRKAHGESKFNGSLLWIARKREIRPQNALYGYIEDEDWPLFDACGPEREANLGCHGSTAGRKEYRANREAADKKKREESENLRSEVERLRAVLMNLKFAVQEKSYHPVFEDFGPLVIAADAALNP